MIKEGVLIGDRYEIMGRIGTGGMADVYKGRDHKLNRYVALKVLKREFREDELFVKNVSIRGTGSSWTDASEHCKCI